MIRSLTTLVYGIMVAVLVVTVSVMAAVYIIGLAAKAALFGEPRTTLAMKILERLSKSQADITHITPEKGE